MDERQRSIVRQSSLKIGMECAQLLLKNHPDLYAKNLDEAGLWNLVQAYATKAEAWVNR